MGPPGTITRLHFDAARAYGYLGQVIGRKLFVVYPPSDTPFLYRWLLLHLHACMHATSLCQGRQLLVSDSPFDIVQLSAEEDRVFAG